MVVVAQEFPGDLRHTIHGVGALDRVLRCRIGRRRGPERRDGTRSEHRASLPPGHFEDVVQPAHVHRPGLLRSTLSPGREDRCQVVDAVRRVASNHLRDRVRIGHIQEAEGTGLRRLSRLADVGGEHRVVAVAIPERFDHLAPHLARGSRHDDSVHRGFSLCDAFHVRRSVGDPGPPPSRLLESGNFPATAAGRRTAAAAPGCASQQELRGGFLVSQCDLGRRSLQAADPTARRLLAVRVNMSQRVTESPIPGGAMGPEIRRARRNGPSSEAAVG